MIRFIKTTVLLIVATLSASAATVNTQIGDLWYNLDTNTGEATVVRLKGSSGSNNYKLTSIVVPETVPYDGRDYTVTALGPNAFYYCSSATSIKLPETLTAIGDNALMYCIRVVDLKLPNSLKTIGEYAFYDMEALTELRIPEGVRRLETYVAYQCSALTQLILPTTMEYIGSNAFYLCRNLKTIISPLPNFIPNGGSNTFYNSQTYNTATVYIPAGSSASYISDRYCWGYFRNFVEMNPVTGITLEGSSHHIEVGETLRLTPTVTPASATVPYLDWETSDRTVATVSEDGVITGISDGKAVITARALDGQGAQATFEIEVGETAPVLKGDAIPNGIINVADIIAIANYIAEIYLPNFNFRNADINDDGEITVYDLNAVIDMVLNMGLEDE